MAVILSPRGNEASNMMKRFVRYEEAAQYFGIDETLIVAYAKAAGAVYQLSKIRLIKIEPLEDYMKHLTKVGRSSKLIQRKFVRVGEGTLIYNIGRNRFIEMARAAGAVYKIGDRNLADIGIGVNGDGETKTALFCVIPDSDKSYNFIIGMLYTQIFQELYYQADFNCGGRLPIHVTFMLDEFANVALPDDYCSLLSTMRSREISSIIIIQNFAQLKALFKDTWETIPGNCVRPEVASAI